MFVKLLATVFAGIVIWAIAAHPSGGAGKARIYTVRPYDTLWSIAAANYGGDPRGGVWKVKQRNGLSDSVLRPGQKLILP
jgi:LysM repeat protein